MDHSVGTVLQSLKDNGLYDNSIILFMSDNGGDVDKSPDGGSNFPLRGAKNTLWEGGTKSVSFVHSPLFVKKGTYKGLLHVTDLFPTLLTAAGANLDEFEDIDGIDQWDALTNLEPSKRSEIFYNSNPMGEYTTGAAIR